MTFAQVAEVTGLAPTDAARAKERQYSEPGLWHGSAEERAAFVAGLASHGIMAREGGRFMTLSFGKTKADQMASIIAAHHPKYTIALGDAPNDVEMLETADFGVVIANPHRRPLPALAHEPSERILRTTVAGPAGWNEAILGLLAHLDLSPNG